MSNIIAIVGTTASGKTSQALEIAQEKIREKDFKKVVIVSADSKQVYKDLPVLTGADIPKNWTKQPAVNQAEKTSYSFFKHPQLSIELHGVGVLAGDKDWGAGEFVTLAKDLIEGQDNKKNQETLFIIVGGTGFYHQQLFYPSKSMFFAFKPNLELRAELATKSLEELQVKLSKLWPERLREMNNSDKNNPRRLSRAIEIATAKPQLENLKLKSDKTIYPHQLIKLIANQKDLAAKISKRIEARIKNNVIVEVGEFEKNYPAQNLQAKTALGYQEILDYINKKTTETQLKKNWLTKELQYAKRQITWWQSMLNQLYLILICSTF